LPGSCSGPTGGSRCPRSQLMQRPSIGVRISAASSRKGRATSSPSQLSLISRIMFLLTLHITLFSDTSLNTLSGNALLISSIPEQDRRSVKRHFMSLDKQHPMVTYEHQVISLHGDLRWQQWTERAIFDHSGNVREYQSVGLDVTDRRRAEDELRASEQKYRTCSTMLWQESIEQGKATDLNVLIKQTSGLFSRTNKHVRIQRRLQKDLWAAVVDRGPIEQVLLNLFFNASDAMPNGGVLTLRTKNELLDGHVAVTHRVSPGRFVHISSPTRALVWTQRPFRESSSLSLRPRE
jgi:hypothetical protein